MYVDSMRVAIFSFLYQDLSLLCRIWPSQPSVKVKYLDVFTD